MRDSHLFARRSFLIAFGLMAISLPFSRLGMSIATIGFLLSFILLMIVRRNQDSPLLYRFEKKYLFPVLLLFLLYFSEFFRGNSFKDSWDWWVSHLGIWVFALSAAVFRRAFSSSTKDWWLLGMSAVFAVISTISVIHYFRNKEELNALLLQSKHIPVFGGMNHIYFGLFLALLICFLIFSLPQWVKRKKTRLKAVVAGILLAVMLINLHILSSRTGLISFYAGLFFSSLWLLSRDSWNWRQWLGIAGIAIGLPFFAYVSFSSFRNKVSNSIEDLQAMKIGGEEINHKSMSMRFESYRVGSRLFLENWQWGIGHQAMKPSMQKAYVVYESPLYPENRIEPHNQFLQAGIAYGILGVAVWLFFWLLPLFDLKAGFHPLFVAFLTISLFAFILEPLAERQWGMFFFFFFYFWLADWKKDDFLVKSS